MFICIIYVNSYHLFKIIIRGSETHIQLGVYAI